MEALHAAFVDVCHSKTTSFSVAVHQAAMIGICAKYLYPPLNKRFSIWKIYG
jgi:hypothetical protein